MDLRTEYADTQLALVGRSRGMKTTDVPVTKYERLVKAVRQHWLLLFVLLPYNAIHPLPGVSFSMTIEQMSQRTTYEVEALVAGKHVCPMTPSKRTHNELKRDLQTFQQPLDRPTQGCRLQAPCCHGYTTSLSSTSSSSSPRTSRSTLLSSSGMKAPSRRCVCGYACTCMRVRVCS